MCAGPRGHSRRRNFEERDDAKELLGTESRMAKSASSNQDPNNAVAILGPREG